MSMSNYVGPHPFCKQNVFSAIYFVAAVYFNAVMQVYVSQADDQQGPRLPDVGYELFANVSIGTSWPNYMVLAVAVSSVARLLCDRYRSRTIRRWAFLQGTMFFLRGVCIAVGWRRSVSNRYRTIDLTGDPGNPAAQSRQHLRRRYPQDRQCVHRCIQGHRPAVSHLSGCPVQRPHHEHDAERSAGPLAHGTRWDGSPECHSMPLLMSRWQTQRRRWGVGCHARPNS